MAGKYQIQMDFGQAENKAGELDNIAENLTRLAETEWSSTLDTLGSNWKGENAELYIQKGFLLRDNMKRTAASLRQTAETVRTIARNIYNAEMEALRIAQEREAAARQTAETAAAQGEADTSTGTGAEAAERIAESLKKVVSKVSGGLFGGGGGGRRF